MEKESDPEQKSQEIEKRLEKAYQEIGPESETFDNYLRNQLAALRAGLASEADTRKLLRDQVDIAIFSVQHLDEEPKHPES